MEYKQFNSKHVVIATSILLRDHRTDGNIRLLAERFLSEFGPDELVMNIDDFMDDWLAPYLTGVYGRPIYYGWWDWRSEEPI